ncbi:MAG TPA: serine hydrolase domain-containing protein [Gemmatimonadales bacterium]|nr:serine hydrolase domain-containing protein [Gemmatimonadales bacterium]
MVVAALLVAVLVQGTQPRLTPGRPGVTRTPPASFTAATFDPLVLDGIRRGAYPGAALVVGRRDTVLFAKGYGRLTWSPRSAAVDPDSTLWDLASLTKVIATTTALMLLVERGRVDLDAPVRRYLPEFATADVTVRHLLTHTSGLRGTLPLYRDARDSTEALRMVLTEAPLAPPGTRMVYSDLNAILLGEIVRRAGWGGPLDAFATREIFVPLGMRQTVFRPSRQLVRRIAPTGVWRGAPVAGTVNDANAAKLGGVAGHAGLFASARDVARFAQFMLGEGALPGGPRLLRPETVRAFTAVAVKARRGASARTLGWEAVPTGEDISSAGTQLGPRTYGHTGWTGTSLWIDPDRGVFVLLLTNRAFAPRARRSFTVLKDVRGRVADAAARAADGR